MRKLLRFIKNIFHLIKAKLGPKAPKYLGSLTLKPGHTLYEVDTETGEIRKAAFELGYKTRVSLDKGIHRTKSKRVLNNENCIYIPALNERNVAKILERRVEEAQRLIENQTTLKLVR